MRVAISQPTFLPWLGYFDIIDSCDHFVFFDSVQFLPRSWMQRNYLKTPKGLQWLTLPVAGGSKHRRVFSEVKVAEDFEIEKKLKTIESNYSKAPCFQKYYSEFCSLMRKVSEDTLLCRFNAELIQFFSKHLGIETTFSFSSDLGAEGKRSSLLVDICKKVGASEYFSTAGALDYLKEDASLFAAAELSLKVHNYEHPTYTQQFPPFVPYASILDLLFNEGEKSLEILRSGRRDDTAL